MKLEILGKFYDNQSLSIINRNLLIQLDEKNNIDFFITPIDVYDPIHKINKETIRLIKKYADKEKEEPDIQLRHTYPPIWRWPISKKTKVVYIQPWEWCRIPFEWQYKWETFADAVITPSQWTANTYSEGGLEPDKLIVIPNGFDDSVFNLEKEESQFYDSSKFTFVFVGCGQYRKGVDLLINAWKDAFVKADNVQLFIKDSPAIYGQNTIFHQIMRLQYYEDCGTIIYNEDSLSDKEMANIYKNAFAIVHPYRGEGFGMHIQEAFACGAIPVIPKGGPTDEFIPDHCSLKLSTIRKTIDLMDPAIFAGKTGDSMSLMSTHSFIEEPDQNGLNEALKVLYNHHDKNVLKSKIIENENSNTWKNVTDAYINVLKEIVKNGKKPARL